METATSILPRVSGRVAALTVALLLLLTTCGAGTDAGATRHDLQPTAADTGATSLPVPTPLSDLEAPSEPDAPAEPPARGLDAAPEAEEGDEAQAAPEQPTDVPDEVELHEPDLLLRAAGELPDPGDVDGAAHAARVGELTASTPDDDGDPHELDLLAVEASSFRPLTPDVTAQSPAVWERLGDGDVLVRHDVAHELGLELGTEIRLEGEDGATTVRIGALAANGAPPFADVIVPVDVADALGGAAAALVVSAGGDAEELGDALEQLGEVELRRAPTPERATTQPAPGSVELEPFTYTSRGDGTIAIHGDWVQRNIVSVDIPGMGTTRCHRAMVPQLYAALQEIIDEGLYGHFKPDQFGGCWVPRHILWNPDRGLSMHAWGLAIDFNTHDNWYGDEPQMDRRIVAIFEKWGFSWGGHWSTPDGMHFELERVVEVP